MAAPVKINFKIYQGATFREVLRKESNTKVYKPITSITKGAPTQIAATGHGVPTGWRFRVTDVVGMKEINSTDTYHIHTGTDSDVLTINALNSTGYSSYTSGGVVEYNQPVSLSGVTARMHIREKLDSATTILELTTENGGIIIDDTLKTITIYISATATAALTFASAVYSMELINGSDVESFITGTLTLVKEVTR